MPCKNKEMMIKKSALYSKLVRERNIAYIDNYLSTHPCVDCGEKDIIVLEFDHTKDNKEINICECRNNGWSIKRIQKEIDKCEVRCANCHRRITYKRRLEK